MGGVIQSVDVRRSSVSEDEGNLLGTPSTFDGFFRDSYSRTVRLARLLTGSASVAEDLAQEAFMRIHRRFDLLDNPGGYLYQTTVNVCRSWHRGRTREHANLARLDPPLVDLPFAAEELLDAIGSLSYRQRAVLVLRYWLDLSEIDIALALDCRPGTVKSLQTRALDHLRKELRS